MGCSSEYNLLEKIDFTSQRKKMSVIVQMNKVKQEVVDQDIDGNNYDILVLVKGSDDVILQSIDVEKSPDMASI